MTISQYILIIALNLFVLLLFRYHRSVVFRVRWIIQRIRSALSKLTVYLIKCLNHFNTRWLITEYVKDDSFADLTPNDNADPKKLYEEAIQWSLKNRDVKNIALSGPYGSGKSSILKTFQREHAEYEYLNISLAAFKDYKEQDSPKIEFSILHQIFYHVRHQQIPYSRFKRIKSLSRGKLLFRSVSFVCWTLALLFLVKRDWLPLLPQWNRIIDTNGLRLTCIITVLTGSIYILYLAFRIYSNSKFNKLNLTSGELEIVPEVDSILSEHLDEIIYFFEATPYNVVIIEDLDRFQDPEIFTKLREINALVNNSKQINRKISFIYALRDDVFADETRTKFFDFIIPVIPVTNSANSAELLMARIEKMGLSNVISSEFISTISYYISDMRLLINILNEFQLYKGHLENSNLNITNLLGIIIYKNKYPTDFSRLHNNEGMIFTLFDNKQSYINNLTTELVQRRDQLMTLIEQSKNNLIRSIEELKSIYLQALYEELKNFTGTIHLNDQKYTINQLREESIFAQIRTQSNIFYSHTTGDKTSTGFGFKHIEEKIDYTQSYTEREAAIKTITQYRMSVLEQELESVKTKISVCRSYSIQDIINERDMLFLNSGLSSEKLLVYLISNGYLNEEYYYYMSYFYEGRITQKDLEFILSIKDKKALPFNFKLTKTAELIKKLRLKEFGNVEVLNIDLLNYQLANQATYTDELNMFFGQFKELTPTNLSFIETYIEVVPHKKAFVQLLCRACNKLWVFIEIESNFSTEKKERYLHMILGCAETKALKAMNLQGLLRDYIAGMKHFIPFIEGLNPVSKLSDSLHALGVQFKQLDTPETTSELFDCIYRENLYQLNPHMIRLIIEVKGTPSQYIPGTYSSILQSGCDPLISYTRGNIMAYLRDGYLHLPDGTEEDDIAMRDILNLRIEMALMEQIIEKAHFKISEIRSIDEPAVRKLLLKHSRTEASWHNVTKYYKPLDARYSRNTTDELFTFLNTRENYIKLGAESNIALTSTTIFAPGILEELIAIGKLSVSAIKELIKAFTGKLEVSSIYYCSAEQVEVLIKANVLKYSQENNLDLRNKHPKLLLPFIEANLDVALSKLDVIEIPQNLYPALLASPKLTEEQRELLKSNRKGSSV